MENYYIGKDLNHRVWTHKKAERRTNKTFSIPRDIVRPPVSTMEPIYTDGDYLYTITPFSSSEGQQGKLMAAVSFLYYTVSKYEASTGRFLTILYAHTSRREVKNILNDMVKFSDLQKIENPYHLYDLRIINGYV